MHLILLLLAFVCPRAPVSVPVVEAVFMRMSPVLELHLGGQVIRTTAEHPFYVVDQGWTAAGELVPGQELVALGDQAITLNKVVDSQGYETIYNLRVANHHTHFVGCDVWGFSAWAHNQCDVELQLGIEAGASMETKLGHARQIMSNHLPESTVRLNWARRVFEEANPPFAGVFSKSKIDNMAVSYACTRNKADWTWEWFAQQMGEDVSKFNTKVRTAIRHSARDAKMVTPSPVRANGVAEFSASTTRIFGYNGVDHEMSVFVNETLDLQYGSHFGHLDSKFFRPDTHVWDRLPTDGMIQLVVRRVLATTQHVDNELWT